MIREFFVPRVFIIFLVLWGVLSAALCAWSYATRSKRKRFITAAWIPAISGVVSLVVTIVILVFIEVFN